MVAVVEFASFTFGIGRCCNNGHGDSSRMVRTATAWPGLREPNPKCARDPSLGFVRSAYSGIPFAAHYVLKVSPDWLWKYRQALLETTGWTSSLKAIWPLDAGLLKAVGASVDGAARSGET
jgi:hypothetical protein